MNKSININTGYKRTPNYSTSTGNGMASIDWSTTSEPMSEANQLMYGGLVIRTEIIIDQDKAQDLIDRDYYVTEKDYNRLTNSIMNPSGPNSKMRQLFKEYALK